MKRSKKKKNGFTLIELLAVIVILAILLAIAVYYKTDGQWRNHILLEAGQSRICHYRV